MSKPYRDPYSILNKDVTQTEQMFLKPQAKKEKVERYRAGQAPQWAQSNENEDDDDIFTDTIDRQSLGNQSITTAKLKKFQSSISLDQESKSIYSQNEGPLQIPSRIIETTKIIKNEDESKNKELQAVQQIKIQPAKAKVQTVEQVEVKSDRRARIKAKQLEREKEQQAQQEQIIDISQVEEHKKKTQRGAMIEEKSKIESSSKKDETKIDIEKEPKPVKKRYVKQIEVEVEENEEETSEEEEQEDIDDEYQFEEDVEEELQQRGLISVLKPIFIGKEDRETKKKKEQEEIALMEEKQKAKRRKEQETKLLLLDAVKSKDLDEEDEEKSDYEEMPIDDDEKDYAQEYESWKIRELKRIKRDQEERMAEEKYKAEMLRRRNLTDEQRRLENLKLGSDATDVKEKAKMRFMQKWQAKPAFFQDSDDPIFQRDYSTPVGEDLVDKSKLPKILQKRRGNFGKKGQSKYTHLNDQDTTNFDPQFGVDLVLRNQQFSKMAGYKGQNVMDKKYLLKSKYK